MESKKIGAGFGVMLLKNNKILLGRRNSNPQKASSALHGEGTWTMPGGKLDFGESFEEGARRELLEETGISINAEDFKLISLSNEIVPDAHFITAGLLCENIDDEPKVMEPDEIVEWKWFSFDELPNPLFKPSQKIINNYKDGVFYRK